MPSLIKQVVAGLDDVIPEVHMVKMNKNLFHQVSDKAQALFGHPLRSFDDVPPLSEKLQKLSKKLTRKGGFELLNVSDVLKVTEGKDQSQELKQALDTVAHAQETKDEEKTRIDAEEKAEAIKRELESSLQAKVDKADDVVFNVTDFAEHTSGWTGIKMP